MILSPRPLRSFFVAALAAATLAGCAPRDSHAPPFARQDRGAAYEPFSRSAAVEIALREWRLFGGVVAVSDAERTPAVSDAETASAPSPERAQGLWQRVGEYWWLGLDAGQTGQGYSGLHDDQGRRFAPERDGAYAWSAAFVSYVMRMAGAGARFPYAASHFVYVNAALRASGDVALRAEDPALYAPQPGDLVCVARDPAQALRFADLPAPRFWGHCDIVVRRDGEALSVVGGNVQDAVALRRLILLADGRLAPAPARPWLVVLRPLYDAP